MPKTSFPLWPWTVERGQPGMASYGMATFSVSSSAKTPSPDPNTRPILGDWSVCWRMASAAAR
ncbi:MAG: hypothetical protein MUF38_11835 [Anaerolineae bacterium]|nr:hypothetical protein [Anaerolineae bacterium]